MREMLLIAMLCVAGLIGALAIIVVVGGMKPQRRIFVHKAGRGTFMASTALLFAASNWLICHAILMFLGGTPLRGQVLGHSAFLGERGHYVEISRSLFQWLYIYQWTSEHFLLVSAAAAAVFVVAVRLKLKQW